MLTIQRVLVKYSLDDIIKETHLLRPLRFLFYLAPRSSDRYAPIGERIRLALEELGPIFVKFGQAISTRRDLLPPDIADELAKLQDAVPPFPAEQAIAILNAAYERDVDEVFDRFDVEPLAAASIAQVHTAKLHDGGEVIVKVLRPGVLEQIERDLRVLRMLAGLADRYWQHGKRLKPLEVVNEYEHTILDELDLMREAANSAQLKRNFEGSDMLYVPDIYWDYCRPNPARGGNQHQEAGGKRRGDLFYTGLSTQFLSRRYAPGQHLRHHDRSGTPEVRGRGLRHRRHAESRGPAIPCRKFPRVLRS
jgi:ubiquinone biosynthesis protein